MSGPLAIAATTAVLRELLTAGLQQADVAGALGVPGVDVMLLPPDLLPRSPPAENPQLNLFLFNLVRNTAWAGDALPARDARGQHVANPLLALDLHYLVSAYGNREFEAEALLGAALQTLHETPGLGRAFIRAALQPGGPIATAHPAFAATGLADQLETVKISPSPLPSEEIARLWSAFQTPYRPSSAFVASVVLVSSTLPVRTALPVRTRAFVALPLPGLRIDRVRSGAGPGAAIVAQGRLRLEGRQLGAPDLQVWIGSLDFSAAVVARADDAIELDWPAVPPAALRSGAIGALVVKPLMLGAPPTPHEGFNSNVAGFVLCPLITATDATTPGTLRIDCVPPVGPAQRVQLVLNETGLAPGLAPRALTLAAPPSNGVAAPATETSSIPFDVAAVPAGQWLMRLQVDGAASPLTVDVLTGLYDGPQVTL